MNKITLAVLAIATFCLQLVSLSHAANAATADELEEFSDDEFEEGLEDFYGDEEFVSIATGTKKAIHKAPSVASVVTSEDIRNMGASNLSQVLETVPGLHASRSGQNFTPEFWFRGIISTFNPQTLLMINGVSQKSVVRGDSHTVWGEFPVHAIERIEVIRGPGSALYGADAFSGVINVITKKNISEQPIEVGVAAGSFSTTNLWLNAGKKINDWDLSLNFEFLAGDGSAGFVETDAQSHIDEFAATLNIPPASNAPGNLSTSFQAIDLWLSAENDLFSIDFGLQDRSDIGTGQGALEVIDHQGRLNNYKYNLKFALKAMEISKDSKISGYFNYYGSSQEVEKNLLLFPEGSFFGAFPDGFIGNPGWEEYTTKLEFDYDYLGFKSSQLKVGVGYEKQDLFKVTESKNFNPDLSPRVDGLVDVSDTAEIFLPEADRSNQYLFAQIVSQLAPDWELTAGARYDDYSDFGSTVNPRLALVWSTSLKLTTKFMYGQAFRAPAFAETLVVNNPVALGNPNLKPETIETLEAAFIYKASPELTIDFNIYNYEIEDSITFVPDSNGVTATAQNLGRIKGKGFESSISYKVSAGLGVSANIAYVDAQDEVANDDVGEYPEWQSYLMVNWKINDQFRLNSQLFYIGERERVPLDLRDKVSSYLNTNIALEYEINENSRLELLATNLFDDDIREPSSPATTLGQVNMVNDLPQGGRAGYLRYRYSF